MADAQKTEQPTPRRLEKARREGQFPSAKQLISAVQFCAVIAVIGRWTVPWMWSTVAATRALIKRAFGPDLAQPDFVVLARDLAWRTLLPLALCGAAVVLLTVGAQLVVTGFGLSWKKLAPDFKRFNPVTKLREMPSQNLPSLIQALVVLVFAGGAVYTIARDNLETLASLPVRTLPAATAAAASAVQELLWKGAYVLIALGCVDLVRQRRRHTKTLRMTKHEVREEMKESEGNPEIKGRVRRIQRERARRRMMQAVPKATAVVVNPTHYAVAIQYQPESMRAPVVVAKGVDHLALRIKAVALEHLVPIVENPPLAQALHRSVEVGQEIPPDLYRAIAEILAYIYRVMNRRAPGDGAGRM